MAVLVTKWFGVFLVEGGRVQNEKRFPLAAKEIAARLAQVRSGAILAEERELASGGVEVLEQRLKPLGRVNDKSPFFDLAVEEPDRRLLHEASLLVGRDESRVAAGQRDRFVAHAVNAMDELTKTINTLVERLREWYGLHFPEAGAKLPDPVTFLEQVASNPDRNAVAKALPGLAADESIGVELSAPDLEALQDFAKSLTGLAEERKRLERVVATSAVEVAPNLAKVVGDLLSAKLIAKAGSLEHLAMMPASTLQTLGAETALFAHLKEGAKPPKHGLLFQHPLVNSAPWWQRGKFSRILSTNASLAARMDHFGADPGRADELVRRVEAQVARVKKDAKLAPAQRIKKNKGRPMQRPAPTGVGR